MGKKLLEKREKNAREKTLPFLEDIISKWENVHKIKAENIGNIDLEKGCCTPRFLAAIIIGFNTMSPYCKIPECAKCAEICKNNISNDKIFSVTGEMAFLNMTGSEIIELCKNF